MGECIEKRGGMGWEGSDRERRQREGYRERETERVGERRGKRGGRGEGWGGRGCMENGSPREGEYLASCLGTAPPFVKLCYFPANISAIPKEQGVPRTVHLKLYNVHTAWYN